MKKRVLFIIAFLCGFTVSPISKLSFINNLALDMFPNISGWLKWVVVEIISVAIALLIAAITVVIVKMVIKSRAKNREK